MKLPMKIRSIRQEPSIIVRDISKWIIQGENYGFKRTLELSDPEWEALNTALGKLQPGDIIELDVPGELPDEDEGCEEAEASTALQVREKALAQAERIFQEATAQVLKVYDEAIAQAWAVYEEAEG